MGWIGVILALAVVGVLHALLGYLGAALFVALGVVFWVGSISESWSERNPREK